MQTPTLTLQERSDRLQKMIMHVQNVDPHRPFARVQRPGNGPQVHATGRSPHTLRVHRQGGPVRARIL